MEKEIYHEIALLEKQHWWYVARRKIIEKVLSGLHLSKNCDILEIGCGTGGNLALLSRFGNLYAVEMEPAGIKLANRHHITRVAYGWLPGRIPFEKRLFDAVVMLDVLEHISDDEASIKAVLHRLNPDGVLVLTVPAFQFLWSFHDVIARHKRRYTRTALCRLLKKNGFSIAWSTYYNFMLFPVIFLMRMLKRVLKKAGKSDNAMPPAVLNSLLVKLFSSERFFFPWMALPFGVSVLVVARADVSQKKQKHENLGDNTNE